MILVVGATGLVGSEICRQLAGQNAPVRALVRATSNPAKVEELKGLGVEIVHGDLRDRVSLDAACQGAEAVISTASAMPFAYEPGANDPEKVDRAGLIDLIDAARQAGVRHFVYTSFSANIDLDFPLRNAKRVVEAHLRESGLTYTVLRPSYFMEGWLGPMAGFDYPHAKARIFGTGEQPVSWISYKDVARFAVDSLSNPAARDATLELGGPEGLSQLEAVRIFEQVGGQPFAVEYVPEEAIESQWRTAADPMEASFAGLTLCNARGDAIDMQQTLQAFPIPLTSVTDYARQVVPVAA